MKIFRHISVFMLFFSIVNAIDFLAEAADKQTEEKNFIEKIYAKAKNLFDGKEKSAMSYTEAYEQLYLGEKYYFGHDVEIDFNCARELFEQVANQTNNLDAQAEAQDHLGEMYYFGYGVEKNYDQI